MNLGTWHPVSVRRMRPTFGRALVAKWTEVAGIVSYDVAVPGPNPPGETPVTLCPEEYLRMRVLQDEVQRMMQLLSICEQMPNLEPCLDGAAQDAIARLNQLLPEYEAAVAAFAACVAGLASGAPT